MGVFKRHGSKFYHYDFVLDGVRHKKTTRRATKREAEKVEDDARRKLLDAKQHGKLNEITLGDGVERILTRARAAGARDIRMQESRARKLFGEEMVDGEVKVGVRKGLARGMMMHAVSTATVNDLIDWRLAEGLMPATINNEISLLQGVHTYCRKKLQMRVDLACEFEKLKTTPKLRYLFSDEERALLLEVYPLREGNGLAPVGSRDPETVRQLQDIYDLTVFLLDTGCRYSEACTVVWDVVDFPGNTINVYRKKVGNEGQLAMTRRLREVLDRRRAGRSGPYLFTGQNGNGVRITPDRAIARAMTRAGCNTPEKIAQLGSRATAHTLRDTFASKLAQTGKVSLYQIQCLLGHSSPVMAQKYAHLIPSDVARHAATVLDGIEAAAWRTSTASISALLGDAH
jgi:integrase